jgi:hypothetical protein
MQLINRKVVDDSKVWKDTRRSCADKLLGQWGQIPCVLVRLRFVDPNINRICVSDFEGSSAEQHVPHVLQVGIRYCSIFCLWGSLCETNRLSILAPLH